MSKISEWEIGSEIKGRDIYLRLKGYIDRKFSHSFLTIDDADKLAEQILETTKKLKELSCGKCSECNDYITNGDVYYEVDKEQKVHKNCLGSYAENNVINVKLKPKHARLFVTSNIHYTNLEK